MPAFSLFPEAGNSGLRPVQAPRPKDPNRFIESFKEVLATAHKRKQEELDKLEEKTMAILNTMAQPISEDVEAMERLEGDLEAIAERQRRLEKIHGTYDDQAGTWVLNRVMDKETENWSVEEWQSLMTDLKVHDGVISGMNSDQGGDHTSKTEKPPRKKRNQAKSGSTARQGQMVRMLLDADHLGAGQATRQTNTSADSGENDKDKRSYQVTESSAKKTKASSQKVKSRPVTKESLIPDSRKVPRAWTINLEEIEEESVPNKGPSEQPASPQASIASSESSDNLFVGPHKEKGAHTAVYSRTSEPSPPPRSMPGPTAPGRVTGALFERTSASKALPEAKLGSEGQETEPEDRLRREAASFTALPNMKDILLLEQGALGTPLPRKRVADAEVAGALGAFLGTKPLKKKAKKSGEEGAGGETALGPVRWPGQGRRR